MSLFALALGGKDFWANYNHIRARRYAVAMTNKPTKKQPRTTPEFEQARKALANTKPISNAELVKRIKKQN